MTKLVVKGPASSRPTEVNVAEAKRLMSDLLGRVAFGRETILITKRGRPMAKLVPADADAGAAALADVAGWLADDDPFFGAIESIVAERAEHAPRVLPRRPPRRAGPRR